MAGFKKGQYVIFDTEYIGDDPFRVCKGSKCIVVGHDDFLVKVRLRDSNYTIIVPESDLRPLSRDKV